MPTLNQISNLPFENNLLLNGLNMPDRSKLVYDLSGGWNVMDYIVTRNGPARQINGKDGVTEKPIMGQSVVQASIATNVINGNVMRVTFTDTNYDLFRNTFVVGDGTASDNQGLVINHGPGYVDIVVAPPLTAWDAALHFVAGRYITEMFQASINRGSSAVESQYEYPKYTYNQTSIIRGNTELYRRDMEKTWVTYHGDMWSFAQEDFMMQNLARQMEIRGLFGFRGQTVDVDGTRNYSMGLKASIKDPDRGGVYLPSPSLPTQGTFEGFIGSIADRKNASMTDMTILMGRGILNRVQLFTSEYIKFGGKTNTFGGDSVKGLDVYEYAINGINCKFIMAPIFNDRERFKTPSTIPGTGQFTRMQYTAVVLDTDNYKSVDGQSLPASEKLYFGPQEMIMYYVAGVGGSKLRGSAEEQFSGDFASAANHNDATSIGVYSDCCYDFMSYRSGWFELTS